MENSCRVGNCEYGAVISDLTSSATHNDGKADGNIAYIMAENEDFSGGCGK